ncbi:efflux RND transporter periplasmic adaptor subunit [Thermoanaerobacterium sp. R66]|uniref:HlyD family secretion protein n=1 Tax=Thermoanaerobacterium sp. R66 TaxID=2742479 RepID=UPI00237FF2E1|nr:efflux RND transporter periplasmic adaptor subunit [Thermoanaerobacterium sp. R66]MDE4543276.1 efflux RND transporter periplasmic adaptor subunit [Thermoanaerobacterium sp. R66]
MKRLMAIIVLLAISVFIVSGCSNTSSNENKYSGTIEATTVDVQSEISGRILDLYVSTGEQVKKGDKIALLDVSQYEEQAKEAKAALDMAKLNYEQIKNGPKEQADIANLKVEQAQAAYDLSNLMVKKGVITSPISGTITDTYFNAGEIITPGGNIAEISDLSNLWIKIYVPEKYLYKVSLNKDVAISVNSINKKISGKVVYISPNGEFTPKNATTESSKEDIVYEVKIQIKDNVKELKPGMLADVTI